TLTPEHAQQIAVSEFRHVELLGPTAPLLPGNHGERPLPGLAFVGRDDQHRLNQLAELAASVSACWDVSHAQEHNQPAVAEYPNAPRPGREFFGVEQQLGLAPGTRAVAGPLQVARLWQLGI